MTRPLRTETLEGRIFTVSLPLFPTQVCEADFIISDGDELPFLGGLRVIESPGHTPGHLSFFAPQDRILFSGDTIDVNGGRLTPYQGDSTWDREEARRSFDKLMWLKPEIICGGHGFYRMR
jgi:glyoxylase-like metal-dependent hydrolase (beta-lactamase superfamily II)